MSSHPTDDAEKFTLEPHADYTFYDADITLLSADGTPFKVHSIILRLVSSVFKGMFAMERVEGDGPIALEESKDVLKTLLDIIYPAREPSSTMSIAHLRDVAIAADKYDIPSVSNTCKQILLGKYPFATLFSDRVQDSKVEYLAVEKFIVAWDLGWSTIAEDLSVETLSCDLNSEIASDLLFCGHTGAARPLLSLHRQRRVWLYNAFSLLSFEAEADKMGSIEEQSACLKYFGWPSSSCKLVFRHHLNCSRKSPGEICRTSPFWWMLRTKIRTMLDTNASGKQFLENNFFQSSDFTNLITCPYCKISSAENDTILRDHLHRIVDRVPKTLATFKHVMSSNSG